MMPGQVVAGTAALRDFRARPRWIVTDLDGTLVDRNLTMVPRSRSALRGYLDTGGQVVIATGRSRAAMLPYHRELGLDGPAIVLNGACVLDPRSGVVLREWRFAAGQWARVVRAVLDRLPAGSADPVVYVGQTAYRVGDPPLVLRYAARDGIATTALPGWGALPGPVSKVLVACAAPAVAARVAGLVAGACPAVTVVASESTYVELLPPGVDKGAALRWLAGSRAVPLAEIAAIGDNPNDIAMLAVAGLAVAVGDGHPATRAAADLVVGNCADGAVADLVERVGGGR